MRFDAVIFDMDGTLLDTERLIITSGVVALRQMGLPDDDALLRQMVGVVGEDEMAPLRAALGDFDEEGFKAAWNTAFKLALATGIPLRPGVARLLDHLDAIAMPRAVATNSRTAQAVAHLAVAGIGHHFDPAHIHGRDRVARPKPAPDLFLHAAAALGADPARCLVFEDSDAGTEAGAAAGMFVVQVPDQRAPASRAAHVLSHSLLDGARAAGLMV